MTAGTTAPASPFSPDYATARARFLDGGVGPRVPVGVVPDRPDRAVGRRPHDRRRPARGGDGRSGVLVVSSGVHGVEGFFGSAVQTAFLREAESRAAAGPNDALVFLHALNPYGFAWLRRFDEANVDLNRNLLVDGQPYRGSPPRYAALDRLLNPDGAVQRVRPVLGRGRSWRSSGTGWATSRRRSRGGSSITRAGSSSAATGRRGSSESWPRTSADGWVRPAPSSTSIFTRGSASGGPTASCSTRTSGPTGRVGEAGLRAGTHRPFGRDRDRLPDPRRHRHLVPVAVPRVPVPTTFAPSSAPTPRSACSPPCVPRTRPTTGSRRAAPLTSGPSAGSRRCSPPRDRRGGAR